MWFVFNDETKHLTDYRGDQIRDLYRLDIPDYNRETQWASVEALFYDRDFDREDHRPDFRSESSTSQGMPDQEDHRPDLRSESSTSQGMPAREDHRPDLRSESSTSQGMPAREDHRPDLRSESSTSQGMSTFMQMYAVAQSMVDRCKDWLSPDRFVCVFSYCTYGAYLNFLSA